MIKSIFVFILMIFAYFIVTAAEAQPGHARHHRSHTQTPIVCNQLGCGDRTKTGSRPATDDGRNAVAAASVFDANGNAGVVGGRPAGCPYEFCGCEAARYVFGSDRPELNLASNWIRKFPRTAPAPGMAAVRSHHVMVLMRHIEGSEWLVHDGNSGGHLTREHVGSISGYVIVNPNGSRSASQAD